MKLSPNLRFECKPHQYFETGGVSLRAWCEVFVSIRELQWFPRGAVECSLR